MPDYPHHLPGFDYRGFHRYSLTFCTFERRKHFAEKAHVDLALQQILRATEQEKFSLPVYCFMPDHLHLLAEGAEDSADLKAFIARAKQFSGFYFKKATGERLWQRYGFERVLRSDETTPIVTAYIIGNPVRAGLVSHPEEYPFWGSTMYSREALLDYLAWAG
jgi:putative transposase